MFSYCWSDYVWRVIIIIYIFLLPRCQKFIIPFVVSWFINILFDSPVRLKYLFVFSESLTVTFLMIFFLWLGLSSLFIRFFFYRSSFVFLIVCSRGDFINFSLSDYCGLQPLLQLTGLESMWQPPSLIYHVDELLV